MIRAEVALMYAFQTLYVSHSNQEKENYIKTQARIRLPWESKVGKSNILIAQLGDGITLFKRVK